MKHGLWVLFKPRAQTSPRKAWVEQPSWDEDWATCSGIGWEEEGGYLQNFEVVETLENVAWDIPQLIPWDTPRGETQRFKRKEQKVNVKNVCMSLYKSHKRLLPFSMFLNWAVIWLHSRVPASWLLSGQYFLYYNILFHSLWLLFA